MTIHDTKQLKLILTPTILIAIVPVVRAGGTNNTHIINMIAPIPSDKQWKHHKPRKMTSYFLIILQNHKPSYLSKYDINYNINTMFWLYVGLSKVVNYYQWCNNKSMRKRVCDFGN